MTTPPRPKKVKFKKRYVLAEGWPWALGISKPYQEIRMNEAPACMRGVPLNWPDELWLREVPRYRLVLEKVE